MIANTLERFEQRATGVSFTDYQLRREEVNISDMVNHAQTRLAKERRGILASALTSGVWENSYPSLRSFPFRKLYRPFGAGINPIHALTGAVNVPTEQIQESEFGGFFTPLRRWDEGEFSQLRGLSYHVSLDRSKMTPREKLAVIVQDVKEGLGAIDGVDRKGLGARDYLFHLAILDHIKAHSLTAFHALTFHERTGEIPDDQDYLVARQQATKLMSTATRAYYQACLGQEFDPDFNRTWVEENLIKVTDYIADSSHSAQHFTFAEVSNPLTIMLGAHAAVQRKQQPDLIIGIPSGGTEIAVATGLMYESTSQYPAPEIQYIPLSFHYQFHHQGQRGIDYEKLIDILTRTNTVEGKSLLIVDDNSNTGSTLQRMANAAISAGAGSVAVHIAEIDPGRLMAKAHKASNDVEFGVAMVVNMYHPDFDTAMGITWASAEDGGDLRTRYVSKLVRKIHKIDKRNGLGNSNGNGCHQNGYH